MNNIRIWGLVIGLAVFAVSRAHLFCTMPEIARAADGQLIVGSDDGDHARYIVGDRADFRATSLGYDMSFSGSGMLEHLGSRAVLSYIDSGLYASVVSNAKCTGRCLAGPLNAYESQGRIGHLLMIPGNAEALASMKHVALPMGSKFHAMGHQLIYQTGQLDGHSFNGQLGNTSYFLVDEITVE